MKDRWAIINLFCTVISLAGIYLVTSGLTGLESVEEVSKEVQAINLTSPAAFSYSIWGLIYLGFLLFAIHAMVSKNEIAKRFGNIKWLVTVSVIFNVLWIVLDGLGYFILPYVLQWIMMAVALRILFVLKSSDSSFRSRYETLVFQTFPLYAGWLTVALVPFTTDVLINAGFTGGPLSRETWAIIMYFVATIIFYFAWRAIRFSVYLLPLAWTLLGIAIKFSGVVSITAGVLAGLVTLFFFLTLRGRKTSG